MPYFAKQYNADRWITWAIRQAMAERRWSWWVYDLLCVRGTDISPWAKIGRDLHIKHAATGVTINGSTRIGDRVTIYQHVTIGRADMWQERRDDYEGVEVGDDAILCAGATIITSARLRVGAGTIIGANAVLTRSTGDWEIWAGNPARKVGERPHS